MNKRQTRLTAIANILLNNIVGSQEELLEHLKKQGFAVTQATLSRDLKTLRTSKVASELGGYRYVVGQGFPPADKIVEKSVDKVSRAAVESVVISGQLIVIRTRNGYAGGVAYDIDDIDCPYLLGTIAGADTVFVAMAEGTPLDQVYKALLTIIPEHVLRERSSGF